MTKPNKKIIAVLAGSRQEFEEYLDQNGLTESEAIYCCARVVMCGRRFSKVVIIGTFWDRKDAGKLKELAEFLKY